MTALAEVRLLDETLREGDARGYHTHPPAERLALMRRIHEVTGITRFSLGFAVVNPNERDTVLAFLKARREGQLPSTLRAHLYCWYQVDSQMHALIDSIPREDRSALALEVACTATAAIAAPQDGGWLYAQTETPSAWKSQPPLALHRALAERMAGFLRGHLSSGLHEVGCIIQDAFRCEWEELEIYVSAALEGGASAVRLHDTVGVGVPLRVAQRMKQLRERFPQGTFFVHFHDDLGMAVANTLTALQEGAAGADLTVNGVGNRAGNASTQSVLLALKVAFGIELPGVRYAELNALAREVEAYFALIQSPHAPVTGRLLHLDEASGRTHLMQSVAKTTFLPYAPEDVGGRLEAAYAPSSGRKTMEQALQRAADSLSLQGVTVDAGLMDRAWAWVGRERLARAERHRPTANAAMTHYEEALRRSYLTEEDVLAEAVRTRGAFA